MAVMVSKSEKSKISIYPCLLFMLKINNELLIILKLSHIQNWSYDQFYKIGHTTKKLVI